MAEKIVIRILNRDYYIEDNGDPLYMTALARYVEDKMREAGERYNIVDTSRLAVHAALSITGELFRLKEQEQSKTPLNEYRVDKFIDELSKAVHPE